MRDTLSPSGLPGLANMRAVMNICSCLRILESYLARSPRPLLGEDARHAGNARDRSMPSMWHESDSRRAFPSAVGSAGHDGPDSPREGSGMASAPPRVFHFAFLRLSSTV